MFLKSLAKRLLALAIVLIGVSIVSFALVRIAPGDPAELMLPDTATQEDINELRERMGLDKSYIEQYLVYMNNVLHGDFGYSYYYGEPVWDLIVMRFPNSVKLTVATLILAVLIAMPMGIIAGIKKGSAIDVAAMTFALLGQSMSNVWIAIMLILLFGVTLKWLPIQGMNGIKSLIMPAIVMCLQTSALLVRMTRSGMIEVLQEDYITATRARGISRFMVDMKYALKNALLPVVTIVGGQVGTLLAGSMVVETIFAWPGIGGLLNTAISLRDLQLVQSLLLFSAALIAVCNLIVDILYTLIDPRIKFS